VPLQRAFRQVRDIEIVFRRARHAEPLHHPARTLVGGDRRGYDFCQSELLETVIERRLSGLGGVATAPIGSRKPPSDLDRWGEVGLMEIVLRPTTPTMLGSPAISTTHCPKPCSSQ
jgi:hypothetical protein